MDRLITIGPLTYSEPECGYGEMTPGVRVMVEPPIANVSDEQLDQTQRALVPGSAVNKTPEYVRGARLSKPETSSSNAAASTIIDLAIDPGTRLVSGGRHAPNELAPASLAGLAIGFIRRLVGPDDRLALVEVA